MLQDFNNIAYEIIQIPAEGLAFLRQNIQICYRFIPMLVVKTVEKIKKITYIF